MKIKGIERDSKWVDENFMSFPPDIENVLIETVKKYYSQYHDSEFIEDTQYRKMIYWVKTFHALEDVIDEEY